MFSYWLKKRLLISIILSIVISASYITFFVLPYVKNASENSMKKSVYDSCDISFDIPSPTKEQLNEIRSLSFVDDVFGYYITDATLKNNDRDIQTKLMISDCVDSIKMTMFNDNRTIDKGSLSSDCPLYIGSDFASEYNLKIGDELSYNGYVLTVAAIVEPDTYKECVLLPVRSGDFLNMIESKVSAYSGAYIKVSDMQAAEAYLRSYKPAGRLKDRSVFNTDEEYQIHYQAWLNASYFNEITSFDEKAESVHLVDTNSIWIGSAAFAVVFVLMNLILFLRKTERVYFKSRKSNIGLKAYYVCTFISDLIFVGLTSVLVTYLAFRLSKEYVLPKIVTCSEIIAGSTMLVVIIVCLLINLALLKGIRKNNKANRRINQINGHEIKG